MILNATIKRRTSYVALMALIIQMGLASLICATSSTPAGANTITICTPFGIKTVTLDENGDPVEQDQQPVALSHDCIHCASGCNGGPAFVPGERQTNFNTARSSRTTASDQLFRFQCPHGANLSRAPPLSA